MLRKALILILIASLFACTDPTNFRGAKKTVAKIFKARSNLDTKSELVNYSKIYLKDSRGEILKLIREVHYQAGKYKSAKLLKKGMRNYMHKHFSGEVIILQYLVKYEDSTFSETYILYPATDGRPKVIFIDIEPA